MCACVCVCAHVCVCVCVWVRFRVVELVKGSEGKLRSTILGSYTD